MDKQGCSEKGQKEFEIVFEKNTEIDKRSLLTV